MMMISDFKEVKFFKKKITFMLVFWVMDAECNIFQQQCFETLQFLTQLQPEHSLGHQRHQLKDLINQSKPFLSGPFLRLVCVWLCLCAWSSNHNVDKESANLVLYFTWGEVFSFLEAGPWIIQQNTLFYYPAWLVAIADFLLALSCLSYEW